MSPAVKAVAFVMNRNSETKMLNKKKENIAEFKLIFSLLWPINLS